MRNEMRKSLLTLIFTKKLSSSLLLIYRFGRNRKAMDERAPKLSAAAMRQQHLEKQRQDEIEKYKARKAHQDEQERYDILLFTPVQLLYTMAVKLMRT